MAFVFIYEIKILPFSIDKLTKNDKSKSHVRLLLILELSLIAMHTLFTGTITSLSQIRGDIIVGFMIILSFGNRQSFQQIRARLGHREVGRPF